MNDLREILVDPSEKIVSNLGNNYVQNFLNTGYIGYGFAVLTDRRVYFKGNCLYKQGRRYVKRDEDRILDIEDVTGSGFETNNPISYLIIATILTPLTLLTFILSPMAGTPTAALLGFIPLALCIVFYVLYFIKRRNLFKIDYAGGSIAFSLGFISKEEAASFSKALRQTKDASKAKAAAKPVTASAPAPLSDADELVKYSQLLAQGVITQEEFEAKKKQILGL